MIMFEIRLYINQQETYLEKLCKIIILLLKGDAYGEEMKEEKERQI